jgi:peptide deformylase
MAKLSIVKLPDPVLKVVSTPVETIDDSVRRLADGMFEAMYEAPGVGLAAVQVGVPKRLIVLDTSKNPDARKPLCMVNPEVVALGDELRSYEEGCLSIPDVHVEIERPATVTVKYLDLTGKPQELSANGLLATAIQHELDHLEGRLIIDFLSRLRRDMVIRRFKKLAR